MEPVNEQLLNAAKSALAAIYVQTAICAMHNEDIPAFDVLAIARDQLKEAIEATEGKAVDRMALMLWSRDNVLRQAAAEEENNGDTAPDLDPDIWGS